MTFPSFTDVEGEPYQVEMLGCELKQSHVKMGEGEELYLPEVRHGGGKWALRGDVGRVPGVVVHLEGRGERERREGEEMTQ